MLPEADELFSKAKIRRNYDNNTSKRQKLSARVSSFPARWGGVRLAEAHIPWALRLPAPLGLGAPVWPCSPAAAELVSLFQPQISAFSTSASVPSPFCRWLSCPRRWMLYHPCILSSPPLVAGFADVTPSTLDPLGDPSTEPASQGQGAPGKGWV